jgi:hypothetical protein
MRDDGLNCTTIGGSQAIRRKLELERFYSRYVKKSNNMAHGNCSRAYYDFRRRPKTSDFGTVLERIRFPQNKPLTIAVSRGFSEREQPVFLKSRRRYSLNSGRIAASFRSRSASAADSDALNAATAQRETPESDRPDTKVRLLLHVGSVANPAGRRQKHFFSLSSR